MSTDNVSAQLTLSRPGSRFSADVIDNTPGVATDEKPKRSPAKTKKVAGAAGDTMPAGLSESAARAKHASFDSPAALRGGVKLTLHTNAAQRMWHGRKPDKSSGKAAIKSIPHFGSQLRQITISAGKNDPWADWWLIKAEKSINESRLKLHQLAETLDGFIKKQLPEGVSLEEAISQKPVEVPVHFDAPMAFQAAYLIADFDKLVRRILMVRHYGLLGRSDSEQLLDQASKVIRSLLTTTDGWRHTGVTRDDVAAKNPKAESARKSMGDLPVDVLRGEQRSALAPPIRRNATDAGDGTE